jgi:ribosome biogenesis GTPase
MSVVSRAVRTEGSRGAGAAEREQVLVANAEQAIFVFAAASPAPNFGLLDRFLVMGEKSEIERIIVIVNKIDLTDRADAEAKFAPYAQMGYTLLYTSALAGVGIDDLRGALKDRISVFTGPSGVARPACSTCFSQGWGARSRPSARAGRKARTPPAIARWSGWMAAVTWRTRRAFAP